MRKEKMTTLVGNWFFIILLGVQLLLQILYGLNVQNITLKKWEE